MACNCMSESIQQVQRLEGKMVSKYFAKRFWQSILESYMMSLLRPCLVSCDSESVMKKYEQNMTMKRNRTIVY